MLLQNTAIQNRHTVGERHGFDLVVRHVDGRGAEFVVETTDFLSHLMTQFRIQVGQGFVHQQHLRSTDKGSTERNTLTLPAAELLRFFVKVVLEFKHAGGFFDTSLHFSLGKPFFSFDHTKSEGEVVANRHVRVERIGLEHHAQASSTRREMVHRYVIDADGTVRDFFQTCQHPKRRGFPTPRGP